MTPPSSRPPAGVPTSGGNAKYAVVVAILLLGIGGLLIGRFVFQPTPATPARAIVPSASASATTVATEPPSNPKLEDIPPPPPVEEKPEGGSVAKGPAIAYVPTSPCEARCTGAAPPELSQALQIRGMQARRCYNEALARDPSLRGHVDVRMRISPSGNVCSVNVTRNELSGGNVAGCAAHILGGASYPAPQGGCIEVDVPLSFVPQGS